MALPFAKDGNFEFFGFESGTAFSAPRLPVAQPIPSSFRPRTPPPPGVQEELDFLHKRLEEYEDKNARLEKLSKEFAAKV
jgi:hypothetical protein